MKSVWIWIGRHLFAIGLAMYGVTAWFSEGYHHPDEHFQILEFASYKLGRTPASDLPWEFGAGIRPGLQPMLTYGFLQMAEAVRISNPFTQIFLLRLLTGWLCLWMFFRWAGWLSESSSDERVGEWLRRAVVFLWFMPYLSVRFSSENLAALAFWCGTLLVLKRQNSGGALAGFLLGLSFFLRFQMAFALAGLGAWLVWQRYKKTSFSLTSGQLTRMILGAGVAIALGVIADQWLYGKPVFTAYNYFTANILENKAAHWGVDPWWFYFTQAVLTAVPPISIAGLFLAGIGFWKHRNHAVVWAFLPFLMAHLAVGHKEMRFLYPMVLPVLIAAVWGLQKIRNTADVTIQMWKREPMSRLLAGVYWMAIAVNFVLLPARCLVAAQEAVPCLHFLYRTSQTMPLTVFSTETSAYNLVGLETHFYRPPNVETIVVEDFSHVKPRPGALVVARKLTLENVPPELKPERVYTYLPDWILQFNPNDWQSRSRIWSVYRLNEDH